MRFKCILAAQKNNAVIWKNIFTKTAQLFNLKIKYFATIQQHQI